MSDVEAYINEIARLQAENEELRNKPNLGLAMTRELLAELRTRIMIDYYNGGGGLEYTTVGGRPSPKEMKGVATNVSDSTEAATS
jgi:hypothetical protein